MDVLVDHRLNEPQPAPPRRSFVAPLLAVLATLAFAASTSAWGQSRPRSQPAAPDEALWREIEDLSRPLASDTPYPEYFELAAQRREALLEKVRSYLAVYPGGPRRDEVVRTELRTLFEIATLSGGDYSDLQNRVQEYLDHPSSDAAASEAAYWMLHLRRLRRSPASSGLAAASVAGADSDLLRAYRAFVALNPNSRYAPRVIAALYDDAEARGDWQEAARLVTHLRRAFPQHAVTKQLVAQLHRHEAIGQPVRLTFTATDGSQIDTGVWDGEPVLVVFWAGCDEHARECVAQIDRFRNATPGWRVIGINLDSSADQMNAACRELGLNWPQRNDGMGWAGPSAIEWGIRRVPRILVISREGRLMGVANASGWRQLLLDALEN